jgi:hypothetical protein
MWKDSSLCNVNLFEIFNRIKRIVVKFSTKILCMYVTRENVFFFFFFQSNYFILPDFAHFVPS